MITNPNTCGLFEPDMTEISEAVHAAGGLVYCDGANFNAIVGRVRPGDLGIDAMHINLHKTFSTPHGGGGPGVGAGGLLRGADARSRRCPSSRSRASEFVLVEEETAGEHHGASFGRMTAFHGQMGMFTRALSLHPEPRRRRPEAGRRGCGAQRQLRAAAASTTCSTRRSGRAGRACTRPCSATRASPAASPRSISPRALIDEGYHPMTMYFPLVVHGAMLVEPTETESKAALDQFIGALRSVAERAKAGDETPEGRAGLRAAPAARRDAGGEEAGAGLQGAGSRGMTGGDPRRSAPHVARNAEPIAEVLRERAAGARAGAGDRQRDRRAYPPFRPRNSRTCCGSRAIPSPAALRSIEAWRAESGPVQPAAAGLARRAGGGLADRAGRRDPVHQHGPHQPVGGDRGADARRRPAARARRAALPLRRLPPGGRGDGAEQRGVRRQPQGARSANGGCGTSRTSSRRRRRRACARRGDEMPANNLSVVLRKA